MSEEQEEFNVFEQDRTSTGDFTRRTIYQVECNKCGMVKNVEDEIVVREFITTHRCGGEGYEGRVVTKRPLLFGNPKEAADG